MDDMRMAQLLLPHVKDRVEDIINGYPPRQLPPGAMVTRLAPSPTGELHIGTLYAAYISYRMARQSNGAFYVRLDDTDSKREVEGSCDRIPLQMKHCGIDYQEGFLGNGCERGHYGPYVQSHRAPIYQAFVKQLVAEGKAYPCFCTEEELAQMRDEQKCQGVDIGYYGAWARHRNIGVDEAEAQVRAGKSFVVRFRSPGAVGRRVEYDDLFKGKIDMPENIHDIIILKSDGLPTYHFAHAVDDMLMHTTHALRGDEWLASYPVHRQLFEALGYRHPVYGHIAPIMKKEGNSKRKFSKRRDADGHVSFYIQRGVPPRALQEYYMHLVNSTYEEWRMRNPDLPLEAYAIDLRNFSVSGPVFDLNKLENISKNMIAAMTAEEVLQQFLPWAKQFDAPFHDAVQEDIKYASDVLNIGRGIQKPRKDIGKWSDISSQLGYFWDAFFSAGDLSYLDKPGARKLIEAYRLDYDASEDKGAWFGHMKEIAQTAGYAPDMQTFRIAPSRYVGMVGDAAGILRCALTGRTATPDLFDVMQVMGYDRVMRRLNV